MLITCISLGKLLIVFRTIFRYSKWGKMNQIQSDTFGLRNTKKKSTVTATTSETNEGKTKIKEDKQMKKAKARI
jgi:hypothetical protein